MLCVGSMTSNLKRVLRRSGGVVANVTALVHQKSCARRAMSVCVSGAYYGLVHQVSKFICRCQSDGYMPFFMFSATHIAIGIHFGDILDLRAEKSRVIKMSENAALRRGIEQAQHF